MGSYLNNEGINMTAMREFDAHLFFDPKEPSVLAIKIEALDKSWMCTKEILEMVYTVLEQKYVFHDFDDPKPQLDS